MKGNISNTRRISIEGNLSNDDTVTHTISGVGNILLNGGTISSAGGGSWTFSQAVNGWGTISSPFTNTSTITANSSGNTLHITGTSTSGGTLSATSGAILSLESAITGANLSSGNAGELALNGANLTNFTQNAANGSIQLTGNSTLTGTYTRNNYAPFLLNGYTLNLSGVTGSEVSGSSNPLFTVGTGTLNNSGATATTIGNPDGITLAGGQITNTGGGTFTINYLIKGYGLVSGVSPGGGANVTASGGNLTFDGGTGVTLGSSSGAGANLNSSAGNTLDLKGKLTYINPGFINPSGGIVQFDGVTLAAGTWSPTLSAGTINVTNNSTMTSTTGAFNSTATLGIGPGITLDASGATFNNNSGGTVNVTNGTAKWGTLTNNGAFIQSGGTNTVTGNLTLGTASGASGTYSLSAGGSNAVGGNEYVGNVSGATGTFTQNDGTNAVTGNLYLGYNSGSSGTYNLSGGSLSASNEYVGYSGSGVFSQSGGTNTVAGVLALEVNPGSSGTYNLSGGTLTVGTLEINSGNEFNQTGGSFDALNTVQSGGSASFAADFFLGINPGDSRTYSLSGGTFSVGGSEYIGYGGTGTFTQTGGSNVVSNYLYLGYNSGASGSYSLSSGGSLSAADEYVGNSGTGTFTQNGGTNTVPNLWLGNNSGASGSYSLSGGSLAVVDNEFVGNSGTGSFTQSGGTNTVGYLSLGTGSGASGSYSLSGSGSLVSGTEYVGLFGSGSFTQTGGTNTVNDLYLGLLSGASGTYNLSGTGSLAAGNEYVGYGSSGVFTQSGGSNAVSSDLNLGYASGASGTYNLSDSGSGSTLSVAGSEYIGNFGSGAFTQSGGTNTASNYLYLGYNSGASGSYSLSGGSLAAGNEYVGYSGSGTFSQTGGSNAVTNYLYLGYNSGGSGTYNLSGGGSLSATDEYVGNSGTGTFTQNGGTNTVPNLWLGNNSGASGSYSLSGGSLAVVDNEFVGNSGTGSFTQSGGTNTVGYLSLGTGSGASGSYSLSGSGSLVSGTEYVGLFGSGTFTQTGGTNTVTDSLSLAALAGASGTYNLQGGSLSAPTFNVNSGGTFNYSGGSFTGNLNNSGTVAPGLGIQTINGNYTQTSTGTLLEQIGSTSSYSQLAVTGSASLNGTLEMVRLPGYTPGPGTFSNILSAAGGVTGTFSKVIDSVTGTSNITDSLYWTVGYTANGVNLFDPMVARNYTNPSLPLSRNQWVVGNMLNSVSSVTTGDLGTVLSALDGLTTSSAAANAYQQISPDKAAALSTLAFAGANLQRSTLSRRITDLRFGPGDTGTSAGGLGAFNLNYAQGQGLMVASNASSLSGLLSGQKDPGALDNSWGVYFDPSLSLGAQGSTLNQTGFGFTMGGFTAGVDYRVWQDLLLGLNTGYTYTGASFHGSGGYVHGNTWPINAYAAYLPKPFYAYGSLGYALNLYNLQREFNFGGLSRAANSSSTGNQLNAYGETGYDFKLHPLVLTPALTLSYSQLWLNGFTENNAGALNLTVGPQNAQSLQTGIGGKIAMPLQRNSVTVTPQFYAFYQHEYGDGSRTLDAHLSQAGNGFNYLTSAAHRDFAVLGADITIATRKNLKVQLDYNAEVGRGNYTAHYISAGLRWEF